MNPSPLNEPLFGMLNGKFGPLLAAASLLGGCASVTEKQSKPVTIKVVSAHTFQVSLVPSPEIYEVTGRVRALLMTTISTKLMAKIERVNVREGDRVKRGELLAILDSRELSAGVQVARAGFDSTAVGVKNAPTIAKMERLTSDTRILQAQSQIQQAHANLAGAKARRDLSVAGARSQEVSQAHSAVLQAESNLNFARTELDRTVRLVEAGALARRDQDAAQNRYDIASGQLDVARQSENVVKEGNRRQEIRAAEEAVRLAEAGVKQAFAGLASANAAAMQVKVRFNDINAARALSNQAAASLQSAQVGLSYTKIYAPFDGQVVQRLADPGTMANPGSPVLVIESEESRLEVSVPEQVMSHITMGAKFPVRIDALAGQKLWGKVVEVTPQGDATSHTFVVKLSLEPVKGLKSGFFGRASLSLGTTHRTMIPTNATWEREGLHYVYALNPQHIARLRIVTLGRDDGRLVEVLSGLSKGEEIVDAQLTSVSDGVQVRSN